MFDILLAMLITYICDHTLIWSSFEYKYLSIWVSPASTSHNKMSPSEAVVLIIPSKEMQAIEID